MPHPTGVGRLCVSMMPRTSRLVRRYAADSANGNGRQGGLGLAHSCTNPHRTTSCQLISNEIHILLLLVILSPQGDRRCDAIRVTTRRVLFFLLASSRTTPNGQRQQQSWPCSLQGGFGRLGPLLAGAWGLLSGHLSLGEALSTDDITPIA